ncbi:hypothetical protein EGN72_07055 [Pseudorhodobacter sp. E13]|uniref:hypothetical protein n=1 Tax=Pseudorhodobacter sp. E13 TaxID=2487931 RepID=UPI000F8E458B|nr:hypothetical protein [Pseudorhodobacter sp. E13]RUS60928.1 hypothetical protein EGN72_07055 [Pseudorhodobacter sp. E13]
MAAQKSDTSAIMFFNGVGVAVAYFMLALSIWMAPVDLSTKGYWGLGILLLTLALVNFVKYRFDAKIAEDRLARLEDAKNEKLMAEYIGEK